MKELSWFNLYGESWQGEIHPSAFAHPAKFSRALIRQIYKHLLERGYVKLGDSICDPFGGVSLGAIDAMQNGLHWYGCELEPKFVDLGNQNIDLWNQRYSQWFEQWGTAQLIQGDSRQLAAVLGSAQACVSSPPFGEGETRNRSNFQPGYVSDMMSRAYTQDKQGVTPGNLATLRADQAGFSAAVGSPPYAGNLSSKRGGGIVNQGYTTDEKGHTHAWVALQKDYDDSDGQLGNLKEGSHADAIVSSPPYSDMVKNGEGPGAYGPENAAYKKVGGYKPGTNSSGSQAEYGQTEGNLGNLANGDFAAAVSSPPYKASLNSTDLDFIQNRLTTGPAGSTKLRGLKGAASDGQLYGESEGQLGTERGDTFWLAAKQIVEQVYMVLRPGGYAIWVCKDFVRGGKRVEFSNQWQALCEACGFVPVERIRAWVVEEKGTQGNLLTGEFETKIIQRKSFFRRLAERKGSPAIDWEDILLLVKPSE